MNLLPPPSLYHPTSLQPITETRFLSASSLPTAEPLSSFPQFGLPTGVPQKHLLHLAKVSWLSLLRHPVSSHMLLMKPKLCFPQPSGTSCLYSLNYLPTSSCTLALAVAVVATRTDHILTVALHHSATQGPVHKSVLPLAGPRGVQQLNFGIFFSVMSMRYWATHRAASRI